MVPFFNDVVYYRRVIRIETNDCAIAVDITGIIVGTYTIILEQAMMRETVHSKRTAGRPETFGANQLGSVTQEIWSNQISSVEPKEDTAVLLCSFTDNTSLPSVLASVDSNIPKTRIVAEIKHVEVVDKTICLQLIKNGQLCAVDTNVVDDDPWELLRLEFRSDFVQRI